MNNKAIVAEAVRRAQKVAREKGLLPGKNVAHPDDPITYELISVDGDVATVGLKAEHSPTGKEVRKQFPLKELFNPFTARELITSVMEDEFNKNAPPGCGVTAVEL
ncbi:MAG: hypothetical protein HYT63_04085 [Candidatus Yanofskybacteria bacterium]|nr:hypothetical protein [Candidatus Yanofskybacteria bacterium]